jgi:hypothetical protein
MEKQDMTAPDQLKHRYDGPSAWTRTEMEAQRHWAYTLDSAEIDDLRAAVKHANASGKTLMDIGAGDFPLPVLARRIATLAKELEDGRGFELWRGLPVVGWSIADRQTAFWGLGLHLGAPIVQNAAGDLLGSVRDTTGNDPQTNANSRFYHTNRAAPFHVDGADVVGLMCISTAREGGASLVVSSSSIYNAILEQHPDLVPLLYQPLWFDHRGENNSVTGKPYWVTSICGWVNNKLSMMYLRNFLESGQRYEGVPPLTDEHRRLFDVIDALAESPELCLSMDFQPGDIQWLNNHTALHSRTRFTDCAEPDKKRWLLRLWLNFPERKRFTETYGFYGIARETLPDNAHA